MTAKILLPSDWAGCYDPLSSHFVWIWDQEVPVDPVGIFVAEQSIAFAPVLALVAVDGFSAEYILLQTVPRLGVVRCVSHRRYRLEPEDADEQAVESQFIEDLLMKLIEARDPWVRYNCALGVRFMRTCSANNPLIDSIDNVCSDESRSLLFTTFQRIRTHARTLQIKHFFDEYLRKLEVSDWDVKHNVFPSPSGSSPSERAIVSS